MLKKMLGIIAMGSCALTSCDPNFPQRTAEYMKDKPIKEFDLVIDGYNDRYEGSRTLQSKLDSVAFRDVFNGTNAAKDSSKVAEFNKIASINRTGSVINTLKGTGISTREFHDIRKEAENMSWSPKKIGEVFKEQLQFKTDSIQYRKFFEKHNLLDKKTLKHFNDVCKKIKP